MTTVEFHVLPEDSTAGPALVACQQCDKSVAAGQRVHIHAPDAAMSADLDKLLWTFRQGGFLSHQRLGGALEAPLPQVLIGETEPPESHHQTLVNLGAEVPGFFSRFERVIEIVHGDAATRAKSRERFKFYRDRGYPLQTYKL